MAGQHVLAQGGEGRTGRRVITMQQLSERSMAPASPPPPGAAAGAAAAAGSGRYVPTNPNQTTAIMLLTYLPTNLLLPTSDRDDDDSDHDATAAAAAAEAVAAAGQALADGSISTLEHAAIVARLEASLLAASPGSQSAASSAGAGSPRPSRYLICPFYC